MPFRLCVRNITARTYIYWDIILCIRFPTHLAESHGALNPFWANTTHTLISLLVVFCFYFNYERGRTQKREKEGLWTWNNINEFLHVYICCVVCLCCEWSWNVRHVCCGCCCCRGKYTISVNAHAAWRPASQPQPPPNTLNSTCEFVEEARSANVRWMPVNFTAKVWMVRQQIKIVW